MNEKNRAIQTPTRRTVLRNSAILTTGGVVGSKSVAAENHCDHTVSNGESIQTAIDTANPGDTICVEPGTYRGGLDLQQKDGLTLLGAKAGIPAGPDSDPNGRNVDTLSDPNVDEEESVIRGLIRELKNGGIHRINDITIDGFTLVSDGHIRILGEDNVIRNNILRYGGIDIRDPDDQYLSYTVEQNRFEGLNQVVRIRSEYLLESDFNYNYLTENKLPFWTQENMGTETGDAHNFIGNVVENNENGYDLAQGGHTINDNIIQGNSEAGIKADGEEEIDATCNWWGADDGPSGEGDGTGDTVIGDNVTFKPWKIAPDGPCGQDPETKNDCRNGGWEDYGFRNQGQCIRFVETGTDNR